jgi:peptidoglycan/xylan/chitin deacetylase (PgdA/CDA1 family)
MLGKGRQRQAVEIAWPAGARAAVTFSFDDGYDATCEATVTYLQERDLCATYNVITDYVGGVFEGLPTATWPQWRAASRMGHEIASHSAAHSPLAGPLSDLRRLLKDLRAVPDRLAYARQLVATARALCRQRARVSLRPYRRSRFPSADDLAVSRLRIDRIVGGPPAESFAYPAGRHSAASRRAVVDAGFKSARTLNLGLNYAFCDLFALHAVVLGPGTTVDDLAAWSKRALATRAWLIVVLHLVAKSNPTSYPYFCSLPEFQRLLDAVQAQPFWVPTQRQGVRYLTGQALSKDQTRDKGE